MLNPEFQFKLVELLDKYINTNANKFLISEMMTKNLLATLNLLQDLKIDKVEE